MVKPVLRLVILCCVLCLAPIAQGLEDQQGQARRLADYLGQGGDWVVVMIWESGCPACNRIAHEYADFHDFNVDRRARVLGVSIDGPARRADALAFIGRHQLPFPNLIGEVGEVAAIYRSYSGKRLMGTPSFLLFDPRGRVRALHTGLVPAERIEQFIAASESSARP